MLYCSNLNRVCVHLRSDPRISSCPSLLILSGGRTHKLHIPYFAIRITLKPYSGREMEFSSSLFVDLTEPRSTQSFEATNFIRQLIQVIGIKVCCSRRNNQVLYRLVEQARMICDETDNLIAEAGISGDWDVFETYNQVICLLERFVELSFCDIFCLVHHTLCLEVYY